MSALESGRGLNKAKSKKDGFIMRTLILERKEEAKTTNRKEILDTCTEFYQHLCEDLLLEISHSEEEYVPPILYSEVA